MWSGHQNLFKIHLRVWCQRESNNVLCHVVLRNIIHHTILTSPICKISYDYDVTNMCLDAYRLVPPNDSIAQDTTCLPEVMILVLGVISNVCISNSLKWIDETGDKNELRRYWMWSNAINVKCKGLFVNASNHIPRFAQCHYLCNTLVPARCGTHKSNYQCWKINLFYRYRKIIRITNIRNSNHQNR